MIALLSNGSYGVMITSAGAGYSTWRGLDVTRWREDATRDCWGQFYFVRDLSNHSTWSIGIQPLCQADVEPEFDFHADRAEFRRRDGDVETRCAVCVVPDADAELRVVTLINHGRRRREIELTSYAEVCLNDRRADQATLLLQSCSWRRNSIPCWARSWPDAGPGARTSIQSGRYTLRQRACPH